MNPKEKAKELVGKFIKHQSDDYPNYDDDYHAKKCALICVQEIFELGVFWNNYEMVINYPRNYQLESTIEFWNEVKEEIEKL